MKDRLNGELVTCEWSVKLFLSVSTFAGPDADDLSSDPWSVLHAS